MSPERSVTYVSERTIRLVLSRTGGACPFFTFELDPAASELPSRVSRLEAGRIRPTNAWSCQWNSLCVIFHSPLHLTRVNTSDARAFVPASLPDQRCTSK